MLLAHRCHIPVGSLPNPSARVPAAGETGRSNTHTRMQSINLFKERELKSNLVAAPLALAVALCGSAVLSAHATKVDAAIPGYNKTSGVSGNLNSVGSDTLNNLMTLWAE